MDTSIFDIAFNLFYFFFFILAGAGLGFLGL